MLSLAMIKTKAKTEPASTPTSSDAKRNFMCCREISKQSKCEKCKKKRKQEHGKKTKEGPSQIIRHGNQSCCGCCLLRGLGLELLSWALMFAQHSNNKRNQKPTSTLVRKVLPLNFCECRKAEEGAISRFAPRTLNLYPNPRARSRLRRMPKQLKLLLAKK